MARRTVENDLPTMNDEDKHKLFTCPYNKYHRITALKYPGHVALCRKQYSGKAYKRCPFNARHEFPEVEYDYHVSTCPDKKYLEKELTSVPAPNVQLLNHEGSNVFNSEEDWESEANHVGFSIGGDTHLDQERTAYDVIQQYHDQLEEKVLEEQQQIQQPVDLSGLSKAQKKNLKRAQKRREKHISNGVSNENGGDDDNDDQFNQELTAEQKERKLRAIAKEYAIPGRPSEGAFVDWVSILNQYCQKNRINQPKYSEATNALGGFGSSVVVTTERFFSDSYCRTKKEAKHSAARAALLGLNIAVSTPDPCRAPHVGGTDVQRARETVEKAAYLESRMTNQPRVIPGYNPTNQPSSKPVVTSSQVSSQVSSQTSQVSSQTQNITTQMAGMAIQNGGNDEWQVANRKKGNNALRLAGIGRGRARR